MHPDAWTWGHGMRPLFDDRVDAGRQLAGALRGVTPRAPLVVLALPRGGVPVGYEVAAALHAPLGVITVRKLGVPGQEELAFGAVASGGLRYLDEEIIARAGVSPKIVEAVTARERVELDRRDRIYHEHHPFPEVAGSSVAIIDDGVATGSTMLAAIAAVREKHPAEIIAAAPVMSVEAAALLARAADACVAVAEPDPFMGVGLWYRDFSQTQDEEVLALLEQANSTARTT
ncbi:MAG TPA: phosphoribosyltransferase family protein [Gemmatimonadaceae bacterium]